MLSQERKAVIVNGILDMIELNGDDDNRKTTQEHIYAEKEKLVSV